MMQEVEVLKTIPELVCSYFSEEQFTLSKTVKGVDIENILIYRNLMRKILNKNYTWRIV